MARNQHLKKEAHREEMVERKARRAARVSGMQVLTQEQAKAAKNAVRDRVRKMNEQLLAKGLPRLPIPDHPKLNVLVVGKAYDRTGKR